MRKGDFVPSLRIFVQIYRFFRPGRFMAAFLGHVFRVDSTRNLFPGISLWNVDTCPSNDGFFFFSLPLLFNRSIEKNNLLNYMVGDSLGEPVALPPPRYGV